MWSVWLVFWIVVFILSALWWIRIRDLWKLPDGKDGLWGKLGLVLMGRAMLSKSLVQFSVDGWGCVPFLLFGLRPNCWPTPPLEIPGHKQASLAQSLAETLLLSPGSWWAQTAEQLYQRNFCTVKKVLGPTTDFPTWAPGKGTENTQVIWLWRPVGFDYRMSRELGKQTLRGHKQNIVHTRTQRPHRDWARPAFECLSVSCGGMGHQWPAAGAGTLCAADLYHTACSICPLGGGHH